MQSQPTALIVGATGMTGSSIVDGLLESQNFKVAALVRPTSADKQAVTALKGRGVEIRIAEIEHPSRELNEALQGVDVVISAVNSKQVHLQRPLIDACKTAGVKRFIPSDFSTPCVKGVRDLSDMKLEIHDYIQEVGLAYTFIDVGWWFMISLPIMKKERAWLPWTYEASRYFYGTDHKCAVTDLRDVGKLVAKIVVDPRSLNKYVFCRSAEYTQREIFDIVEEVTGEKVEAIKRDDKELLASLERAKSSDPDGPEFSCWDNQYSTWIRGDSNFENARKVEGHALDAKDLYPDLHLRSLVDFAREWYA